MKQKNIILRPNTQYTLLDSGRGRKLEKINNYIIVRPEKQALWKESNPNLWKNTDAEYTRSNDKFGDWKLNVPVPKSFIFKHKKINLKVKLTPFGHIGIFPEQSEQWDFISQATNQNDRILSLFSYTGAATLTVAEKGAVVVHVDASKPGVSWAVENQKLSGLKNAKIRWIIDDAMKFVKREKRRGSTYDGIIMDPPKFGRGPKGEVWQFEKDFPELLESCAEILSSNPKFFLITAYTVPISPITLGNLLKDLFKNRKEIECGELGIEENVSGRVLPTACYARWSMNSNV